MSNNKQTKLDNAFLDACENNNIKTANLLYQIGANINARDENSWTAIICACINDSYRVAEFLIDIGANINISDNNSNETPLMHAITQNGDTQTSIKIIHLLIDKGADVNTKNKEGQTALMLACEYNRVEAAKLLIEAHADIDAIDNYGRTALIYACNCECYEASSIMVNLLVDNKANTDIVDTYEKKAIDYCTNDILKNIINKSSIEKITANNKAKELFSQLLESIKMDEQLCEQLAYIIAKVYKNDYIS